MLLLFPPLLLFYFKNSLFQIILEKQASDQQPKSNVSLLSLSFFIR